MLDGAILIKLLSSSCIFGLSVFLTILFVLYVLGMCVGCCGGHTGIYGG